MARVAKAAQRLSVPNATATPNLKRAKNIFLIRSATPEQFKKCVGQLRRMAPNAALHIVSHERDGELVASLTTPKDKFYAYAGGGNYGATALASIIMEVKKTKPTDQPDTFVMLSNNIYGYPHIAEILCELGARTLHLFNINERWYTTTREELDFKNACARVYLGICNLYAYAK